MSTESGLPHGLHRYKEFHNARRLRQGITNFRLLAPLVESPTDSGFLAHLKVQRRDRLGDVLYEYYHAA